MGIASNSISYIRKLFKTSEFSQPPYIPSAGNAIYTGMGTTAGAFGFDYLNTNISIFGLQDYTRIEQDLIAKYVDYEDQDESPIIASCHDIYSDDSTQSDTIHKMSVWVESQDEDLKRDLNYMLHHQIKIEESIWGLTRTLCKYGNFFGEVVVRDKIGVLALNHLPPPTVRRIEIPAEIGRFYERDFNTPETVGFIYDPRGVFKISTREFLHELAARSENIYDPNRAPLNVNVFENWEVVHMRLVGKRPDSIYGQGIGEPARWLYKRLVLLEDSVILHRLTRAPSRYAYYVDVTGVPPQETQAYLNRVRQGMNRQKYINPDTGKLDMRYMPLSPDQDMFFATRDGKDSARVEPLQGPVYDAIEDIKYFENKLFAALKVPKPFLTYEESTAKTNLSAEDARFARTVLRIQREIRNGIRKICQVHLAAKGIDPRSVDFTIEMTLPSAIFELAQLEIRNAELDLAEKFQAWAPTPWIMTHILGFSEEQIQEMELAKAKEGQNNESKKPKKKPSSPPIHPLKASEADMLTEQFVKKLMKNAEFRQWQSRMDDQMKEYRYLLQQRNK